MSVSVALTCAPSARTSAPTRWVGKVVVGKIVVVVVVASRVASPPSPRFVAVAAASYAPATSRAVGDVPATHASRVGDASSTPTPDVIARHTRRRVCARTPRSRPPVARRLARSSEAPSDAHKVARTRVVPRPRHRRDRAFDARARTNGRLNKYARVLSLVTTRARVPVLERVVDRRASSPRHSFRALFRRALFTTTRARLRTRSGTCDV